MLLLRILIVWAAAASDRQQEQQQEEESSNFHSRTGAFFVVYSSRHGCRTGETRRSRKADRRPGRPTFSASPGHLLPPQKLGLWPRRGVEPSSQPDPDRFSREKSASDAACLRSG